MSLTRVGRTVRLNRLYRPVATSRFASSHAEHHEHDHHDPEPLAFPREGFSTPFWRRAALFGLLVVGFYKFAPSPNEDNTLSRIIARYLPSKELWEALNLKHLQLSVEGQEDALLVASAKLPQIHRYRYPQQIEQVSPHLQAIGTSVDLSDLRVKGDKV